MKHIPHHLFLTLGLLLGSSVLIFAVTAWAAETPPTAAAATSAVAPASAVSGRDAAASIPAATAPASINWTATDLDNHPLQVPAAGKITILLFAMGGQEQRPHALSDLKSLLAGKTGVQVVAVVSGQDAPAKARGLVDEAKWTWPVVADADYAASGKMAVHVWPTTLIVKSDGRQTAHLAGYPASYPRDLAAHLDFAAGKIDAAALETLLAEHNVVAGSADDVANRHLQLSERLLEQGQVALARQELDKGLTAAPANLDLHLLLVRVELLQGQAADALKTLDAIDAKAAAPWKLSTLRGWALVKLEKWEQAQSILTEALKLNPAPAEARYLLGLVCQHQGDFKSAAEHFRIAFEHTPAGQALDAGK